MTEAPKSVAEPCGGCALIETLVELQYFNWNIAQPNNGRR